MAKAGYAGRLDLTSGTSPENALRKFVSTMLGSGVSTAKLVQVQDVYPAVEAALGGSVGWVDVLPLVNGTDVQGNPTSHGTVFGLPYFRLQGGSNAIIIDPKVGDIGLAVIADRDISAVKRAKQQTNPGSARTFDMADGLYFGGFLNGAPTQFVEFISGGGITIKDSFSNIITMDTNGITINGILFPRGGVSFDVKTHTHNQPADSHGDTESPTNGPNDGS